MPEVITPRCAIRDCPYYCLQNNTRYCRNHQEVPRCRSEAQYADEFGVCDCENSFTVALCKKCGRSLCEDHADTHRCPPTRPIQYDEKDKNDEDMLIGVIDYGLPNVGYVLWLSQGDGCGCDYNIACGQKVINLDVTSWDKAVKLTKLVSKSYSDYNIADAVLMEVNRTHVFDCKALEREIERKIEEAKKAKEEAAELLQLEALMNKYKHKLAK